LIADSCGASQSSKRIGELDSIRYEASLTAVWISNASARFPPARLIILIEIAPTVRLVFARDGKMAIQPATQQN
jgi:hypothetical protein